MERIDRKSKMKVIIIGGNHHNTLGVIRSLGYVGLSSHLILVCKEKNPYVSHSKFINKCFLLHEEEDILPCLLKNFSHLVSPKPVIIACADSISSYLDCHYNQLKDYFLLPGAKEEGRISYFMDKEIMSDLARKVGMNVPQTVVVTQDDEKIDVALPFPWIIKPLVSKDGSKSDIKRCFNEKDWESYLAGNHCKKLQVQQLIDKEYEFQLIGCSLDSGNQLIIPGYARNIRPSDVTNTGYLQYLPTSKLPVDIDLCRTFIKSIGYSGLFSMEFIHGKDGIDYFMEINLRNDGNSICVTASGLNLPYIWCLSQCGEDICEELDRMNRMIPVYVMPEFDDLILLLKGKVNAFTWLKDLFKTDCFMEFSSKDPKPFIYALSGFLKRAIRFIGKKAGIKAK